MVRDSMQGCLSPVGRVSLAGQGAGKIGTCPALGPTGWTALAQNQAGGQFAKNYHSLDGMKLHRNTKNVPPTKVAVITRRPSTTRSEGMVGCGAVGHGALPGHPLWVGCTHAVELTFSVPSGECQWAPARGWAVAVFSGCRGSADISMPAPVGSEPPCTGRLNAGLTVMDRIEDPPLEVGTPRKHRTTSPSAHLLHGWPGRKSSTAETGLLNNE